ncbi:MAG: hypothetical protein ABJF01_12030 [bacterium]
MTSASISVALAATSLCLAGVAGVRWRAAVPVQNSVPASVVPLRRVTALVGDDSLAAAEDVVVTNDPFRLSNSAPTVRYDPATDGTGPGGVVAAPAPLRPVLVLKAIVGGPPWEAVIDGFPGHPDGTIAQQGSRFDKLVVRAVTRDSVIVQAPDTSWVLSFRRRS